MFLLVRDLKNPVALRALNIILANNLLSYYVAILYPLFCKVKRFPAV